jgi:hypothetical protein
MCDLSAFHNPYSLSLRKVSSAGEGILVLLTQRETEEQVLSICQTA